MKTIILFFGCLCLAFQLKSQDCNLSLSGKVTDKSTGEVLPYATILLPDNPGNGTITDSNGNFRIESLCPGGLHLEIGYTGFKTKRIFYDLNQNLEVSIELEYHDELLSELVIHGAKEQSNTQVSQALNQELIEREANKNLGNILENISGVNTIKNGSGIAKPVIHGLYGNRITILNNGIPQAGQQWGNDHAPEIDPYSGNHVSVVKGASAIEYLGNSIGGVVLVEPDDIDDDPHIHGGINYIFQTNGRGHTVNSRVGKAGKWFRWRATGTFKQIGDLNAPDYYLTNTGKSENNGSLLISKDFGNLFTSLYYSYFGTDIGILRGSHIGNLTDLESAIGRDRPFFTEQRFSNNVSAPRQEVGHHLIKFETTLPRGDDHFKFRYSFQANDREEYDVRRSGRTNIPALSLNLQSHFADLVYHKFFEDALTLKSGIQFRLDDNVNDPETGILPLIPNYLSMTQGVFVIGQKDFNKLFFEMGGRLDYKYQDVASISRSVPRVIERYDLHFFNYAFNTGLRYKLSSDITSNLNFGVNQRPPEINELFSFGLHQGVSGIERGDRSLSEETSFKSVLSFDWRSSGKLFVQALGYAQHIRNYIFLEPADEFELTIRGAFPVYNYNQTDASLIGADLTLTYEPIQAIKWNLTYSGVRGFDVVNDVPLIFMPPPNFKSSLIYYPGTIGPLSENSITITGRYIDQQRNWNEGQDFLAPPDAYFLLGIRLSSATDLNKNKLRFFVQAENLTNVRYRDFLNRLRYFADEPGINLNVGLNFSF